MGHQRHENMDGLSMDLELQKPKRAHVRRTVFPATCGEKKCSLCLVVKQVNEFHAAKGYADGYYSHCKECHYETYGRDFHFRRTYGISLSEYNRLSKLQNNKCTCCDVESGTKRNRLVVDHCHSDGGVRGLICQSCNMALGNAKDDPSVLRRLANYLDDYYGQRT